MSLTDTTETLSRDALILRNLRDPSSAFYKGMNKLLRAAAAKADAVDSSKPVVVLPFKVADQDEAALQKQFGVRIKSECAPMRTTLSPRVAGLVYCVDEVLAEHAGGYGKTVLHIDGDAVQMAVRGIQGRVVERTGATARLAAGYAMEDELLARMAKAGCKLVNQRASSLIADAASKEPSKLCPRVGVSGSAVDTVVVNHFKTFAGPHQLAYLSKRRGAGVMGALPFQLDMLERDSGRLAAFPGVYYVDRAADMITLVPDEDAAASLSHPYKALVAFVQNNSVTVDGDEFLVEKYMSYPGVLMYTIRRVGSDFEAPEVLRSHYFDPEAAKVTVLHYPRVKKSAAGFPVGWDRGEVRILTSRYEKVLARVMNSKSSIVKPSEAYVALMDNNNLFINTVDTAVMAERMDVVEQQDAALAIALHVNFRRHHMRATLSPLLDAVKARHASGTVAVGKLLWMAMAAWFAHPDIRERGEVTDVDTQRLLDWCGNDFSVFAVDAQPWMTVEQVAGKADTGVGAVFYTHLPAPVVETPAEAVRRVWSRGPTGLMRARAAKAPALALVNRTEVVLRPVVTELSAVKSKLYAKLQKDTLPVPAMPVELRGMRDEFAVGGGVGPCPVPDVDVYSAVAADAAVLMGGLPSRRAVATGYELAALDVRKEVRGNFSINDAKRLIPGGRWVRQPLVDLGVEAARVPSQASLVGAVFKRNTGVPNNREYVDLDRFPKQVVEKVIRVCFREDWQDVLKRHLEDGMWQPCEPDLDDYVQNLDVTKARAMLDEFFLEGEVTLRDWTLMAKGKVKASREPGAQRKVDHAQTIMYLENKTTNAHYSAQTRRFKRCLDEMLRPEVALNSQRTPAEHEEWYNSLSGQRASCGSTHLCASDIRCYDRSQEHPALLCEMEFYKAMGLNKATYDKWIRTHGVKVAASSMYGLVLRMVAGGVSGLWKTLLRNGLINLFAIVVSAGLTRNDIVMCDIKGDDMDLELSRPIDVEKTSSGMCRMFNLSAKISGADIRFMCKDFRFKKNGRWYHMRCPWAAWQSVLSPVWLDTSEAALGERWNSLVDGLRHYDNGILVDEVANLAARYYGMPGAFKGMARALSKVIAEGGRSEFVKLFGTPVLVY